jgi:hypothetical protein
MVARRIRSAVMKFVLVTGLAAALFGGSVALAQPSHASAARLNCEQALQLADYYNALGDVYNEMFHITANMIYATYASHYYGMASAYSDFC